MKPKKQKLYKVLKNGKSFHGGEFTWSLPAKGKDGRWKPGKWHSVDSPIQMCKNGFHLTEDPANWYSQHGCEVFVAEVSGAVTKQGSKIAVSKVRLQRKLSNAELTKLRIFREGRFTYVGSEHTVFDGASGRIQNLRQALTACIVGKSDVSVYGKCHIDAYNNSRIRIHDSSNATVHDHVLCFAYGGTYVRAIGEANVNAHGLARVDGYDRITASLRDHSSGYFSGASKVFIHDSARAEIRSGEVQAFAEGSSTVTVRNGSPNVELLHHAVEINRTQQEEGKITTRAARDRA